MSMADLHPLGSLTTWMSGGTPNRGVSEYWTGTIPWISASTMKEFEVRDSDQHVTLAAVRSGSKMAPLGSTLLLVRGSALHSEIRASLVTAPVCFNQDVKALIPNARVHPRFLTHSLRANSYRLLKLVTSAGNTAGVLDTAVTKRLSIWLPTREVQAAIVETLDDVEDLIAALERLIAKKQAIKQGMMQQLLTGRTRLPGFESEWTPVLLRDAGSTYGGLVGKSKDDFGTGSAQFVTFMEVMAGVHLYGARLERVNVGPAERQNRVLREDVLFNGSSETPEEVALAAVVDYDTSPRTYLNSFCFGYRLKARDQIDPTYLAHFFRSGQGRDIISILAQGATRYNIAKTKLMQVAPLLPPIDEQRAIVEVLGTSEAEIDSLSHRLAKARAIKTGMMQQLLTGRVRLPVEGQHEE